MHQSSKACSIRRNWLTSAAGCLLTCIGTRDERIPIADPAISMRGGPIEPRFAPEIPDLRCIVVVCIVVDAISAAQKRDFFPHARSHTLCIASFDHHHHAGEHDHPNRQQRMDSQRGLRSLALRSPSRRSQPAGRRKDPSSSREHRRSADDGRESALRARDADR